MSDNQTLQDETLMCEDCNMSFPFSAGEQEFYASKGFPAPKRCKDCRAERKAKRASRS